MNEMVERVARAIATSLHRNPDATLADGRQTWLAYVPTALATIAAMRDPTEAMGDAGFDAWDDQANSERVLSAWQAMIDAALAD